MKINKLKNKIAEYIKKRGQDRLEKFDKEAEKKRSALGDDAQALAELEQELSEKRVAEEDNYQPNRWLSNAAKRAKQISLVSHAVKFTHTDAKGSSILVRDSAASELDQYYLSSSRMQSRQLDIVGNAAALDVANLLTLESEGQSLIEQIAAGDLSALAPFTENQSQLQQWQEGFLLALADQELSSHKFAKQLYFPLPDGSYHLLSPLYASSLAQQIYQRINESRYSESSVEIRKAKREEKYHPEQAISYPKLAVQNFGGTKPQNVSQLNSQRRGKSYLLNCQSPQWQWKHGPPVQSRDSFWREFSRRANPTAFGLKQYLIRQRDRDSSLEIRNRRAAYVDDIIAILLNYAAEIQTMTQYAGWSRDSKLPLAEQLWLDPGRDDEDFILQRQSRDWQASVADKFARWLNGKLKDRLLKVSDAEFRQWSSQLNSVLRLQNEPGEGSAL